MQRTADQTTVTLSSTIMEDFVTVAALPPADLWLDMLSPYVSADGDEMFFYTATPATRVYRDRTSPTGWNLETVDLSSLGGSGYGYVAPTVRTSSDEATIDVQLAPSGYCAARAKIDGAGQLGTPDLLLDATFPDPEGFIVPSAGRPSHRMIVTRPFGSFGTAQIEALADNVNLKASIALDATPVALVPSTTPERFVLIHWNNIVVSQAMITWTNGTWVIGDSSAIMTFSSGDNPGPHTLKVVATSGTTLAVLAADGLVWTSATKAATRQPPSLIMTTATYDPALASLPRWGMPAYSYPAVGNIVPVDIRIVDAVPTSAGGVFGLYMLETRSSKTCHTVEWSGGAFDLPVPVAANAMAAGCIDESRFIVIFADATARLFTREPDGETTEELISPPGTGKVVERLIYRSNVSIADDQGNPVASNVSITSSEFVEAQINGERYVIGPTKPVTVGTDFSGAVWVSTEIRASLASPTLTFSAPELGQARELRPDDAIRTFLNSVTPADLLAATDPRDNTPLLGPPFNNDAAADALREALGQLLQTANSLEGLAPAPQPWRLRLVDGNPVIETLTRQEADALAQATQGVRAEDVFDDIGDVFVSIADGIASVIDFVVDAGQAILTFVIDGVQYVFTVVLDAFKPIFDLISSVFSFFGVPLGRLAGWLASKIGQLFGLNAVLARRDAIKASIRAAALNVPNRIPSPTSQTDAFRANLAQIRGALRADIDRYRSSPQSSQTMSSMLASMPKIPTIAQSLSSQASWLLEKATSWIHAFAGSNDPALSLPGLSDAISLVAADSVDLTAALIPTVENLLDLAEGWVGDLQSLTFGSTVTVIEDYTDTILDKLDPLIRDVGLAADILYSNPTAIFDWLDAPLDQNGFFGAFYKELFENPLSILDFSCLLAACMDAGPFSSSANVRPETANDTASALEGILRATVITSAISAGLSITGAQDLSKWGSRVGLADAALGISAAVLLYDTTTDDYDATFIATMYLVPAAAQALGSLMAVFGAENYSRIAVVIAQLATLIIDFVTLAATSPTTRTYFFCGFEIAQTLLTGVVEVMKKRSPRVAPAEQPPAPNTRTPLLALVYMGAQGALSGAKGASLYAFT